MDTTQKWQSCSVVLLGESLFHYGSNNYWSFLLVVALSAKGKELWQRSDNTANELLKRYKKNLKEGNEFFVLWHDHLFLLIQGTTGINRTTASATMQSQGCKEKSIFINSSAPVGFAN